MSRPLRVANCSGFFGDRLSAAREMVDGGPIDVLTGDWLAELTMGVLAKQVRTRPDAGFASTFVTQVRDVLSDCLDRGIKIVSDAGGLNPHGCADRIREIAGELGRPVRVAVVDGDDASEVFEARRAAGWPAEHRDTGAPFPDGVTPLAVNAYLGAWGVVQALDAGADVVITGRVTDAALIIGPAAWHHRWRRDDWDALAGALVAGHIIECGAQACGGNYPFFHEIPDMREIGFPIAEIAADGSSVITKHPGTGGAVTPDTVISQLVYEIDGPRYLNPDVVARLDTVSVTSAGADRVAITGVRGEPAPDTVKVGAVFSGGWRNSMTFVLTGGRIDEKARVAQDVLWRRLPGGRESFDDVTVRLLRADRPDPARMEEAVALLTVTVKSADRARVAAFSRYAVETGLATYPGAYFDSPPGPGSEFMVFWPALLPADLFTQRITLDGRQWTVPSAPPVAADPASVAVDREPRPDLVSGAETVRLPLGALFGARSGDKAGNATLGVWARDDASYRWLRAWWSSGNLRALVPEFAGLDLHEWELPPARVCGVTVVGLLGDGVAANPGLDAQAKGLAEYVRAKHITVPRTIVPADSDLPE